MFCLPSYEDGIELNDTFLKISHQLSQFRYILLQSEDLENSVFRSF